MKKFIPILIIFLIISCGKNSIKHYDTSFKFKGEIIPGKWLTHSMKSKDKIIAMRIYFPKKYKRGDKLRTIIALHSYGSNHFALGKSTSIETYANKYNMIIVCPDMGKSIQALKFFPESSNKWHSIPGGKFIGENLLQHLAKNFAISGERKSTGIMGIGSGGRGALLISASYNNHFAAVSGLSGNYDNVAMKKSRWLIPIYGEYKQFKDRWKKEDNILKLATNLKNTSVYLVHGRKDYLVSSSQSLILAIKLKQLQRKHGGYKVTYNRIKNGLRSWMMWNKNMPGVMEFFHKNLK